MLGAEYLVLDLRMMFSCIWYHSFSLLHLQKEMRGREGGASKVAISGSRWRGWDCARGDYTNSMCPCDDFLLEKR